jgi:hypothetical protein
MKSYCFRSVRPPFRLGSGSVAMQRLCKHVLAATITRPTLELLVVSFSL